MFVVVALADVFVAIAVVAAAKYNNDNSNNKGRQRITAATSEASAAKGGFMENKMGFNKKYKYKKKNNIYIFELNTIRFINRLKVF